MKGGAIRQPIRATVVSNATTATGDGAAALVALLAGGAGMTRAVADPAQRDALLDATRAAARRMAGLA